MHAWIKLHLLVSLTMLYLKWIVIKRKNLIKGIIYGTVSNCIANFNAKNHIFIIRYVTFMKKLIFH